MVVVRLYNALILMNETDFYADVSIKAVDIVAANGYEDFNSRELAPCI